MVDMGDLRNIWGSYFLGCLMWTGEFTSQYEEDESYYHLLST